MAQNENAPIRRGPKLRAKAQIRLRFLKIEMDGHFGDCTPVGDGVFELRFFMGPGYRVYFGMDGDEVVLLLCGGDKSSQERDISRAKRFWRAFQRGKG